MNQGGGSPGLTAPPVVPQGTSIPVDIERDDADEIFVTIPGQGTSKLPVPANRQVLIPTGSLTVGTLVFITVGKSPFSTAVVEIDPRL